MSETQYPNTDLPKNVTPIEQAPSVVDPNDLEPTVVVGSPVAETQPVEPAVVEQHATAPSPNRNIFQSILYKIGGHREGEKPEDTRKRGAVVAVGTAVAGAALAAAVPAAAEKVSDAVDDYQQAQEQKNVQVVEDYNKTGILEEGKVVIEANKVGVAEQFATEVSNDTKDAQELVGVIQDQTDAQGDPGVQPGEIAVVEAEQVDPTSPQIIDQGPAPK